MARVQTAHGGHKADGFPGLAGRFYRGSEFGNSFGDHHAVTLGPAFFPASRSYDAGGWPVGYRRLNHK